MAHEALIIPPGPPKTETHANAPSIKQKPGSNFHLAFSFLSAEKRKAMQVFYQFCRCADDIVDEVDVEGVKPAEIIDGARKDLRQLEREIKAAFEQKATTPLGIGLMELCRKFPVKLEHFVEIIKGCEMDLDCRRYQGFAETYGYCYRVASAVGLVCIDIFGCTSAAAREYAVNLGVAFQLTNILRDLSEDWRRGRIYLPQEDFRRFDYGEEELGRCVDDARFRVLMEFECQRALGFYQAAEKALEQAERSKLLAARIMRSIYFAILNEIQRNPGEVFRRRIRPSKVRKIALTFKALFR